VAIWGRSSGKHRERKREKGLGLDSIVRAACESLGHGIESVPCENQGPFSIELPVCAPPTPELTPISANQS
jgi:hypothetical protein